MKAELIDLHESGRPLTKEEFTDKILSDEEFSKKWGDLGPVYGKQWRKWFYGDWWYNGSRPMVSSKHHDQIQSVINDLKNNPDSRRIMVNAWNVGEIERMTLPPCHIGFQLYTRELTYDERCIIFYKEFDGYTERPFLDKNELLDSAGIPKRALSLMWNQRSVDTFLGLPFNIASYGLLLLILADIVNMVPDELIGNLGDTHLYLNHLEQAKEQLGRSGFMLPMLEINTIGELNIDTLQPGYFQLLNYVSDDTIKAPLSN